ncbi:hypothetical protein HD_1733 [[Haemophilus] ducreyi 35000HP]|uniref:Uncharacterized protein n=1 Tax=Haemophilus ducreyi (strain 35000HP / ATCC 700724) TaxID=233412 RepID=Q7VKX8_HAEDU|nr:hypothetical protein HD_1733 [[Haemophilus] ducreyi 35000HP]
MVFMHYCAKRSFSVKKRPLILSGLSGLSGLND